MASERALKVDKNVVGDNRVRHRQDRLEINLFLKNNLRALKYDSLQSPPGIFRSPNSLVRDEESGDESIADPEDEDTEIYFSEDSDDDDG